MLMMYLGFAVDVIDWTFFSYGVYCHVRCASLNIEIHIPFVCPLKKFADVFLLFSYVIRGLAL